MSFEVRFRGENESSLLPWKPADKAMFECTAMEARQRYDELVERGVAGVEVDGVVPHVVELVEVNYSRCEKQECRLIDTMLWQYAENDAVVYGDWTQPKAVA